MSRYRFIAAEKASGRSVVNACRLLKVSRSAFHEWSKQVPSKRVVSDETLRGKIKAAFEASHGTYGAPRVHQQLVRDGVRCARKRVARLMAEGGLVGREKRKSRQTTVPDPEAKVEEQDLVGRGFAPGLKPINHVLVGDITYIRTWQGWLYLATVIDLSSRRVVGFAMADHMRASLVCEALLMAIILRKPEAGTTIYHSDRGSQYTSAEFRRLLQKHGLLQSFSRPRQCWDNAVAESFFATLKLELIHRHIWRSHAEVRSAVFEYIEGFYNRRRLHSALGYRSPVEFESVVTEGRPTQAA